MSREGFRGKMVIEYMKREYKQIIYTYIALQLTAGFGILLTEAILSDFGVSNSEQLAYSIWPVFSFLLTLLITLLLLRPEFNQRSEQAASWPISILWAFLGVFLALFAQSIAVQIELLLGIKPGSENTQDLVKIVQFAPLFMIVTSIAGPILEEIVFRKIIFGTLYKRFNFWISALISSLIFSVAHLEFEHIILYAAIGLTFAFLYVQTKRIIVPILTHVFMNSFVIIVQLLYPAQESASVNLLGSQFLHFLSRHLNF